MSTPRSGRSPATPPPGAPPQKRSKLGKENRRLVLGAAIGALVALFAVLNLDKVEVNWIFGTWSTPLILVIAITFLLGAATGWIAGASRRRRS